jgi:putative ABC transport system permease protein
MTIPARCKKVLGDVAATPFRTALAVAAMAAGAFGVSMILTSYSILTRELAATYRQTRPSSALLFLDRVDDLVVKAARETPGVRDAEARPEIVARMRVGKDQWVPLVLFVVRDFNDLRIDKLSRDAGSWPPRDDEVLLERSGLSVARAGIGDSITVRSPAGDHSRLRVAGTVHAPGLAPGWMDHVVSGFVSWRSIERAGERSERAVLRIVVAGDQLDERHIRQVAGRVQSVLELRRIRVQRVAVPPPGRHPHADQIDTFLFLLGAFAALTLALSAVLVANTIDALLAGQLRQVGIMKAIGATTGQIVALYLGQVAALAVVSLCVGLPLGISAGRAYARFAGTLLNANIVRSSLPVWVTAVQLALGMLVPLLVAFGPVLRASRITIHRAFSNDLGRRPFGARRFDRWLARIEKLPRPLMLSIRSTFHRRGRLTLTVATLAAGGAVFISALNVSGAWTLALESDAQARRYDVEVRLPGPTEIARIAAALAPLPGLDRAEYWNESAAFLLGAGGRATTRVNVIGPPRQTALLHLRIMAGRWLAEPDDGAVVVNQALLAADPTLHVGGDIALRFNEHDVIWTLVGVSKELNPTPTVYAPAQALAAAIGWKGDVTNGIRVATRTLDAAAQQEIERALEGAAIGVLNTQRLADRRKAFADHLVIVESALTLAAALVALVGGLGLATTLSINVAERTREIGIVSALGATPRTIARYVVLEGLILGTLSWFVAVLTAVPVTFLLEAVSGQIFIKSPLDFFLSPRAAGTWLAIVLILGSLSSFYPARHAARLTVLEALSHA